MGTNTGTIMTLANSIIGVSVLAMPFCFKQCGIVLSILMLVASSLLSRLACHFLLKSAVMARRRTFEFLAFHTFGLTGKFTVELFIIGFLMGTCIAFFVVMGDLGPAIVAKIMGVSNTTALRPSVLIGLAVFVVLPLGMLRNVDSLSSVSMATIGFYICLVLKVVGESLPHLLAGDWYENVHFWRPAGIMQCIPIFSMALFCQTQLFEIYESMHNASLDRMNYVIRAACNICTGVYICVGFFGYIAFCTQTFTGNILMSFSPSILSEMIKLGFVLSVAVSFPLVIFPCRASLYSLLFRRITLPHLEGVSSHIPEARFKCLTIFIISVALVIGILIPNIELVLGLVGSTIGVLICVMFPAAAFICMSTKSSNDRLLAQVLLFVGALILVLGTYATFDSANVKHLDLPGESAPAEDKLESLPHFHEKIVNNIVDVPPKLEESKPDLKVNVDTGAALKEKEPAVLEVKVADKVEQEAVIDPGKADKRQEPPVPVEPAAQAPSAPSVPKEEKVKAEKDVEKQKEPIVEDVKPKEKPQTVPERKVEEKQNVGETVDQDAIKREDEELAEAEKGAKANVDSKNAEILRKLEKHEAQQIKILEEQKQILQALQEHQEREERERMQEQQLQQKQAQQQQVEQQQQQQQQVVQKQQVQASRKESQENKIARIDEKASEIQKPQGQNNVVEPLNEVGNSNKILEQPNQKSDLLKQIANGGLKKESIYRRKSEEKHVEELAVNRVKDIVLTNNVSSLITNSAVVPDHQVPRDIAAPDVQPRFEPPAMPVQTVLLERLKNQPAGASLNKTFVQPSVAIPKVPDEKQGENEDEVRAMRREILQEPVASTLSNFSPPDTKNKKQLKLPTRTKEEDPHDREKRDIEEISDKTAQTPVDAAAAPPGNKIHQIGLENKEQNCPITEQNSQVKLEDTEITKPKIISNAIEDLKVTEPPNIVASDAETRLPNENKSAVSEIVESNRRAVPDVQEDQSFEGNEHADGSNKILLQAVKTEPDNSLMIKTATHLSDPQIHTDSRDKVEAIRQGGSPLVPDAKPMKRDLKSIRTFEEKTETDGNQRRT